jgi:DNA-binding IclR family transcriptional regulator
VRPRNQPARDQLTAVLARRAVASASSVAEQLGISIPTLHRMLQELEGQVVATGKARRTRYALGRSEQEHASCMISASQQQWSAQRWTR